MAVPDYKLGMLTEIDIQLQASINCPMSQQLTETRSLVQIVSVCVSYHLLSRVACLAWTARDEIQLVLHWTRTISLQDPMAIE